MKDIESRAKAYVRRLWKGYVGYDCQSFRTRSKKDFIAGAESERRQLLTWNDPAKLLPTDCSRLHLRVKFSDGVIWETGGWYDTNCSRFRCDIDGIVEVVGWRPIFAL